MSRHWSRRLLDAVGPERQKEAEEVLTIGRLSWRLRDDDNVLVGRLESQLLRALELAAQRLRAAGRLQEGARVSVAAAPALAEALRDPASMPVRPPRTPGGGPSSPRRRGREPAPARRPARGSGPGHGPGAKGARRPRTWAASVPVRCWCAMPSSRR